MGSMKRKADQSGAPPKREKPAAADRSVKRQRKSDGAPDSAPAKSKPETAPPQSVFKDEEKSFPRGGASVLTPLEHKQIQIKANQDVLFEQTGAKRTGGADDDEFGDMGSDDGDKKAAKAAKKWPSKKSKKQEDGEKELVVRPEGLNYKVREPPPSSHVRY